MSNRRKVRKPATSGIPSLILSQYGASLLTEPGTEEPLVALRLGGADVDGVEKTLTDYVMFPPEARAIIAQLQQALPD